MSKRIFFANRRVQRFGVGGFFKSLSDPAASAFSSNAILAAPQYVPETPAYIPMEAIKPIQGPQVKMPELDQKLMSDAIKDTHPGYAGMVQDNFNLNMGKIKEGMAKHRDDFLLSYEGKRLAAAATTIDQEQMRRYQNVKQYNDKVRESSDGKLGYIAQNEAGEFMMHDKDGNVKWISPQYYKEALGKGFTPMTGEYEYQLRDEYVGGDEKQRALARKFAGINVFDYRNLHTVDDAYKNIRENFSKIGENAGGGSRETVQQLGVLVGTEKTSIQWRNNRKQTDAIIKTLLADGGLSQKDYNAFVQNFISRHGDYTDKNGRTAHDALGQYIYGVATGKRVDESRTDHDLTTADATSAKMAEQQAGALRTAYYQLDKAINTGDWEATTSYNIGANGVFMDVKGVTLSLDPSKSNVNQSENTYESTLRHDPLVQKLNTSKKFFTASGDELSAQMVNTAYRNGLNPPTMAFMPYRDGKPIKLKQGELQTVAQYDSRLKKATTQEQREKVLKEKSDYLKDKGVTYKQSLVFGIAGVYNPKEVKLSDPLRRTLQTTDIELNKVRVNNSLTKNTSLLGRTADKVMSLGSNQQHYITDVIVPISGDMASILETDAIVSETPLVSSQRVTIGKHYEEGGQLFPVRSAEKKQFNFKPITLQDLD